MRRSVAILILLLGCAQPGCQALFPRREPPVPGPVEGEEPPPAKGEEFRPVKKAQGEIVVAAWAEPRQLPPGGGQAHILVRVQRRGGAPVSGVEVRLLTSAGSLYSRGRILTTDARGMTRDRLTTRKSAVVTMNAGGTRYRFRVAVGEAPSE